VPTLGQDHGWPVGDIQNPAPADPAPDQVSSGATQSPELPPIRSGLTGVLAFPCPCRWRRDEGLSGWHHPYQETNAPGR